MKNTDRDTTGSTGDSRRKEVDRENAESAQKKDDKKSPENEKKLPGEYPANEDIMNRRDQQRVGLDVENFSRNVGAANFNRPGEPIITRGEVVQEAPVLGNIDDIEQPAAREMERPVPKNINLDDDISDFATGNESDVTSEDLEALGPKDLSLDMGDDEQLLKNRVWPVDMAGEDLDVPGSELDDENESIGSEDEENNSYSIGGDRHEDNLEGK